MKSRTLFTSQFVKSIAKLLSLIAILYNCNNPANTLQNPEEQEYNFQTPSSSTETKDQRIKNILKKDIPNLCYESDGNIDSDLIKELNYRNESEMKNAFKAYSQEIQNSVLISEKQVETENRITHAKNIGTIREYHYQRENKFYACYFNEKEECTGLAIFFDNCFDYIDEDHIEFIKKQKDYTNFSDSSSGRMEILVQKKSDRGNGKSKTLIKTVEDHLKEKKLKHLILYTYNKDVETIAHKLYVKTGYKNVIDWDSYYSKTRYRDRNNKYVPYREEDKKDKTYMIKKLN